MTASLLCTVGVIVLGLILGEIASWLLFDNDSGKEETDDPGTD